MPEYLAPGVYVEETSFRPKTIEGVSTSTAGFVGPTRFGPYQGEPRLLTSFADFQRIYGGLKDLDFDGKGSVTNHVAYAVRAFFEEGGQRCYVARVFDAIDSDDDGIATASVGNVTFNARYPGAAGDMRIIIRGVSSRNVNRSGGGLPGLNLGDTVIGNPGSGTTLESDGQGINFYDFLLDGDGEPALRHSTTGQNQFVKAADLEDADEVYPLRVRVLVQREIKRPGGGVEFGPEQEIGEYTLHPESSNPLLEGLHPDSPSGDPAAAPVAMEPATDSGGDPFTTGFEYARELFSQPFTRVVEIPVNVPNGLGGTPVTEYTISLSTTGVTVSEEVRTGGTLTPSSASVSYSTSAGSVDEITVSTSGGTTISGAGTLLYLKAEMAAPGSASVSIDSMSITPDGGSSTSFSNYDALSFPSVEPGDLNALVKRLDGGNDGREPTSYTTDTGSGTLVPDQPEGFDALEDLENVSIVAAPGYTEIGSENDRSAALNVQAELITHCEEMRYRIAVLDTPKESGVKEARDWRGNIDSTYAAMYHPWITIFDPLTRSELNVPPSGHVAGIYARNDVEHGVHKAPANEVVRSAVGFESRINKAQQDVLNPEGVNCFRFFENRGNRLWGARMATSDNEYKYVNIRRYLAYLEQSIDQGTQVFVFENNGADLWRNVRRTISSFLENEWRSNRLMGTTTDQAFFVRCDRSTMTQNDIDNGRLICEIGVALFRPAEYVIFRIGQKLMSDTG